MTVAPRRDRLVFDDLDGVVAAIRDRGGRVSTVRRLLLQALFAADRPLTAEQLAEGVGGREVPAEISSVYRNLEALEALGVVRHLHVGHGAGLYTLERATQEEYLACERCHRVDVIGGGALDELRTGIEAAFGYTVGFDHFPIVGICPRCRAREGSSHHAR